MSQNTEVLIGLVPTIASIDVSDEIDLGAPAYHNPSIRWNGWCCPYFTFDNAMKLSDQLKKMTEMGIGSASLVYNQEADQFIYTDFDNGDSEDGEKDYYGHTLIKVDGQEIKTYAIGAWAWCWHEDPEAKLKEPS